MGQPWFGLEIPSPEFLLDSPILPQLVLGLPLHQISPHSFSPLIPSPFLSIPINITQHPTLSHLTSALPSPTQIATQKYIPYRSYFALLCISHASSHSPNHLYLRRVMSHQYCHTNIVTPGVTWSSWTTRLTGQLGGYSFTWVMRFPMMLFVLGASWAHIISDDSIGFSTGIKHIRNLTFLAIPSSLLEALPTRSWKVLSWCARGLIPYRSLTTWILTAVPVWHSISTYSTSTFLQHALCAPSTVVYSPSCSSAHLTFMACTRVAQNSPWSRVCTHATSIASSSTFIRIREHHPFTGIRCYRPSPSPACRDKI